MNKTSAIEQATDHLRERVLAGQWKTWIPGERPLSKQLGISRPTLREALKVLEREGLLSCEPNCSRRVLIQGTTPISRQRRLTFLTGLAPALRCVTDQILEMELRAMLQEKNIQTDHVSHPSLERGSASKFLEALVDSDPRHGWALLSVSENVQKWFEERCLPAIVLGSVYPGIKLPSFDSDNRGVCRHAASNLIRLGHQRIILVMPVPLTAGDLESRVGFTEAFQQSNEENLDPQIIFVRKNPDDFRGKLKSALQSAHPPTALVTCQATMALTAMNYCQSVGRRIPEDISIISRDSEAYLELVLPRICCYTHTGAVFTQKLFVLLAKLVSGAKLAPRKHLIIPKFTMAESTAPTRQI